MATVNEKMTALAEAIRAKSGVTGKLSLDGMKTAVDGIQTGSGEGETVLYSTIYTGVEVPTNDMGVDGDIYIVRSEA